MGTYLVTGIVQNIVVNKSNLKYEITIDNVIEQLKKEINLEHYIYSENKDNYCWKITPKIFEENLVEFLATQVQMYQSYKNEYIQKTIDKIKTAKNGEQIIEMAANERLVHFKLIDYIAYYISVLNKNNFRFEIDVDYQLIAIFMDGRISMECYNNILRYFENNIRLQRDKYPIVDCIKVMITD